MFGDQRNRKKRGVSRFWCRHAVEAKCFHAFRDIGDVANVRDRLSLAFVLVGVRTEDYGFDFHGHRLNLWE